MTTLKKSLFAIFLLACAACSKYSFDYIPVSGFDIDYEALKNRDTVEVIVYSGGPDYNKEKTYYYHYLVVSKSAGDTARVLSLNRYKLDGDSGRIKIFLASNSEEPIDKMILQTLGDAKPERVVYNAEYEFEVKAKHPTTIGYFLETTDVKF
jgi:hypothetical protein